MPDTPPHRPLRDRLRDAVKLVGGKQSALAHELAINPGTLSKYIAGTEAPRYARGKAIEEALTRIEERAGATGGRDVRRGSIEARLAALERRVAALEAGAGS